MSPPSINHEYRAVSELLSALRRRIRIYVLLEAVLMALVLLGAVFWGGLLLDWMFEPSPQMRMVIHGLVIAAVVGTLLWCGVRRWIVALSDRSLALLIERKHPEFSDSLSAAVDLHAAEDEGREVHLELANRTIMLAAETAKRVDVDSLLNQLRLNRFATTVSGLALSVVVLAVAVPSVWQTYAERIALSPKNWPRTVDLSIEGFEPDGQGRFIRKVARNSDVPIVVNANLLEGRKAPERVAIRYRWQEGRRGHDDLIRIGDAVPGRDKAQRYEYLFERIASNVEFEVRGGDDRLRQLHLMVVERPKVTQLSFNCVYPEYLGRTDRQLTAGPRVELPEGTRVHVTGETNKPLDEVRWRYVCSDEDAPTIMDTTSNSFDNVVELATGNVELEIELLDTDGILSAEPFRVTITARRDQKPQVMVARSGIGTAVTANARLPLELSIEDDHAVRSAWLEIHRDKQPLPNMPVDLPEGLRREVATMATVELDELAALNQDDPTFAFAAGQKLTIVVAADDKYNLADESRASAGRTLSFEIVTEEELLARLAGTEQNLRQTFESVADKLLLLYDSLEKLDQPTSTLATVESEVDPDLLVIDAAGVANRDDDTTRQTREASRLAETARQISDEVLGVAAGFEDIHAQLVNNRVDNSELADRIGNRIASPLRQLGEQRMQAVATKITDVASGISTTAAAKIETRQAIVEVEQLLREMQGLESYNEVVALLRDIIRQQEQINVKTKEEQKNELRDLLLE